MSWHGQINRTIWEIQESIRKKPDNIRRRRELLRAHFLQHFEFDRAFHVPRDDRSFLFLHDEPATTCLLLHGAKGTPAEMRDLGNFLYSQGYSVYCPRFSRLDTKERIVSWESWVTQAENALTTVLTFTSDTIVIGLSLGGSIGLILSGLHSPKGLVLLAPALYPKKSLKARVYDLGRIATPTLFYRLAGWNGEVLKAIQALPALYREPFVLRHLQGWTYKEIAEVMDMRVDSVETRLVRARRFLRETLKDKIG